MWPGVSGVVGVAGLHSYSFSTKRDIALKLTEWEALLEYFNPVNSQSYIMTVRKMQVFKQSEDCGANRLEEI